MSDYQNQKPGQKQDQTQNPKRPDQKTPQDRTGSNQGGRPLDKDKTKDKNW